MNKTLASSRWWSNGLLFSCIGCGRCCRGEPGAVYFSRAEEGEICLFLGMDRESFRLEYVTRRWGRPSISEKGNGECLFYDGLTARCGIYGCRPTQCRTWPFWPELLESQAAWTKAARLCPGMDQGDLWTEAEIERVLEIHLGSHGTEVKP